MYSEPNIIYLEISPEKVKEVVDFYFKDDYSQLSFKINTMPDLHDLNFSLLKLRVFGENLKYLDLQIVSIILNDDKTYIVECQPRCRSYIMLQEDGFYHSDTSKELEKQTYKKSKYSIIDICNAFTNFRNLRNDPMGKTPFLKAFKMAWKRWRFARNYAR